MTAHIQRLEAENQRLPDVPQVTEPPPPPPVPVHRYYLVGGIVIGTGEPNETLQRLLDAGEARELTAAEADQLNAGRRS